MNATLTPGFNIGDKVSVNTNSTYYGDWKDWVGYIAGIGVNRQNDLVYMTSDQWPPQQDKEGLTTDWREESLTLAAPSATATRVILTGADANGPWKCFHCWEVFTDRAGAQAHFGETPCAEALCCMPRVPNELADTHRELVQLGWVNDRLSDKLEAFRQARAGLEFTLKAFGTASAGRPKREYTSTQQILEDFKEQQHTIKYYTDVVAMLQAKYPEAVAQARADVCGEPDKAELYNVA